MDVELKNLEDQVMVIADASSGISLVTARKAAQRGAPVAPGFWRTPLPALRANLPLEREGELLMSSRRIGAHAGKRVSSSGRRRARCIAGQRAG